MKESRILRNSVYRQVYEAIRDSSDGLTQSELAEACPELDRNERTGAVYTLRIYGLITREQLRGGRNRWRVV